MQSVARTLAQPNTPTQTTLPRFYTQQIYQHPLTH